MKVLWVCCVIGLQLGGCAEDPPALHVIPGAPAMSALPQAGNDHFDCNEVYGQFDVWKRDISSPQGAAAGSLYFRSMWLPGKWLPDAKVVVTGPGSATEIAGLDVHVRRDGTAQAEVMTARGRAKEVAYSGTARLGADMRFELRWNREQLSLRFPPSEQWFPLRLPFTPAKVELICSSAEVIFHDVTVTSPASDDKAATATTPGA